MLVWTYILKDDSSHRRKCGSPCQCHQFLSYIDMKIKRCNIQGMLKYTSKSGRCDWSGGCGGSSHLDIMLEMRRRGMTKTHDKNYVLTWSVPSKLDFTQVHKKRQECWCKWQDICNNHECPGLFVDDAEAGMFVSRLKKVCYVQGRVLKQWNTAHIVVYILRAVTKNSNWLRKRKFSGTETRNSAWRIDGMLVWIVVIGVHCGPSTVAMNYIRCCYIDLGRC